MIWHLLSRLFGRRNETFITAEEQMRRERSKELKRLYWPMTLVMLVFLVEFIGVALAFIW